MPQTVNEWVSLGVNVAAIVGAVYALFRAGRKWLRTEISKPMQTISENLDRFMGDVKQNRDIAVRAETKADLANSRIDNHERQHHG